MEMETTHNYSVQIYARKVSGQTEILMTPDISNLKLHELEELQMDVEELIRERKYEDWKSKTHTKEEIIGMFTRHGYTVPKGAKIWRVNPRGERTVGGYGMEVGKYEHSCHIDTTDFIVLLVVESEGHDSYVESFSELWLSDLITV